MNALTSIKDEDIDRAFKILREFLDFIDKITLKINNKATGYEIAFECENYKDYYRDKRQILKDQTLRRSTLIPDKFLSNGEDYMKIIGGDIILERGDLKENRWIMRDIETVRNKTKKEIGYLEFKKFKPKPEIFADISRYNKDIDDFITFLDAKYKEWEESREGKV